MPANKNALIRYKTIDNCLRNRFRQWTLDDLVDACCEALYDAEGITKGVSVRTVQGDIQMMRSDKLGYNAPIEVYDHKYYRYTDKDFSITNMPLSQNDYEMLREAVDMLRELEGFEQFAEMADVVSRLRDMVATSRSNSKPIVNFDSVPNLKGLRLLNPLYNHIANRQTLRIMYQSFNARRPTEYIFFPYLLKEFRNRWFVFGAKAENMAIYNLALDRIVSIETSNEPFRDNPKFDPEHFFDNVIGVSKNVGSTPRTVKFWATPEQSNYVRTKPLHRSQRLVRENPDGSCVFAIDVVINFEMYSVFMSYGPGIKIIYPRNVRERMRNQLKDTLELYDKMV